VLADARAVLASRLATSPRPWYRNTGRSASTANSAARQRHRRGRREAHANSRIDSVGALACGIIHCARSSIRGW